jgi:hypothetical protein
LYGRDPLALLGNESKIIERAPRCSLRPEAAAERHRFSARAASSAPASALGRVLDPLTRTHAHQRNGRRRAASDRRSGDFQDGGTRTRRKTELSCPRRSLSFFVASARVRDLLIRAKDLLEGALQLVALRFMTPIAKV